ncbi:hypothetical protein C8J57DRAFT_1522619 [Mycena rebaudengoi]|nr:hypothetical protein C8J57DRAFT_1522619 [Mycena rebaudengoi]
MSSQDIEAYASNLAMPFRTVPVYDKIKYATTHLPDVIVDSIHVKPASKNSQSHLVPGRFDTVLGLGRTQVLTVWYWVGQVRTIFSFPKTAIPKIFNPGTAVPQHLAYVEWFTAFKATPEPNHLMYKISSARGPAWGPNFEHHPDHQYQAKCPSVSAIRARRSEGLDK